MQGREVVLSAWHSLCIVVTALLLMLMRMCVLNLVLMSRSGWMRRATTKTRRDG